MIGIEEYIDNIDEFSEFINLKFLNEVLKPYIYLEEGELPIIGIYEQLIANQLGYGFQTKNMQYFTNKIFKFKEVT